MNRKFRIFLLAMAMLLVTLSGCGFFGGDDEEDTEEHALSTTSYCMGMTAELAQDQETYEDDSQVGLTLTLTNSTGFYISSLTATGSYSNALMLADGEKAIKELTMNTGETQNMELVLAKAPLYRQVLNAAGSGVRWLGSKLWSFLKAHPLVGVFALLALVLVILIAVLVRKLTDKRLRKEGKDPKAYRSEKRKLKKADKKAKKKVKKAEKKAKKAERKAKKAKKEAKESDKKARENARRSEEQASGDSKNHAAKVDDPDTTSAAGLKTESKSSGKDGLNSLLALLLCGSLIAATLAGPLHVSAGNTIELSSEDLSDEYTMEVTHEFSIGDKDYSCTITIEFTTTLILAEGEYPDATYQEEILDAAWPKEQTAEYTWSDSEISGLAVDAIMINGTGAVVIEDCAGTSVLSRTAGVIGSPVELTLENDTLTEATLTFSYSESALTADGIDESALGIVWYDEENDRPVLMEDASVDTEQNTVSLTVDHFSQYAVVDTDSWFEAWSKAQYVSRGGTEDFPEYFNVVLAIDNSGSMSGDPNELSKDAALKFTENLEDNDLFTIISFNDDATTVVEPTYAGDAGEAVSEAVNGFESGGGTDFDDALTACISALSSLDSKRTYTPYSGEDETLVTGTVTDEDGNPLEGVTVKIYVQQQPEGLSDLITIGSSESEPDGTLTTGEDGQFAINCTSSCLLKITYEKEGYETYTYSVTTSPVKEVDASVTLLPDGERYQTTINWEQNNGLYSVEELIVFLSDGQSSVSSSTYDALVKSGCRVITIGLGSGVQASTLQTIADKTGGVYIYTSDPEELETIYEIIWGIYIGVSPEDNDGDGIPDAVEIAGMRNQYGEIITTNTEYADTDGDGYSDSEEMGVYDDEDSVFLMVSDPTVPSVYTSDAKVSFVGSGTVKLQGNTSTNEIASNDGSKFSVTVSVQALSIVYNEVTLPDGTTVYDYLSETVYSEPENLKVWVTWDDDCLSCSSTSYTISSLAADGTSNSKASRTFYFTCTNESALSILGIGGSGILCSSDHEIQIHAKADNSEEVVLTVSAQEAVQTQWLSMVDRWITETENDVCTEGTNFISDLVDAIDAAYTGEQDVRDAIYFTTPPGNDALAAEVLKKVQNDYLDFVENYAAGKKTTTYSLKSGAKLVQSVAKSMDSTNDTWPITVNGKEYTFNVNRTAVSGVIQWMISGSGGVYYAVTGDMDEAVTQYLNDLKVLGDDAIENCRKQIFSVKNGIELISLTGLQTLYDELGKEVILSALKKVNLDTTYNRLTTLTQYFYKAQQAYKNCTKLANGNLEAEKITSVVKSVNKYLTFVTSDNF